ncbi:hypothetical protein FGO68_gene15641 [Halteria grandinella]|uniref:Uncharacterized protein n=1 Tax=Halteria grandinella TaxID=5974 RepID=A0A8J8T8X1_HALGN|nr:hypothetical protein FGO68_gene15641 [Halteria grandinella]
MRQRFYEKIYSTLEQKKSEFQMPNTLECELFLSEMNPIEKYEHIVSPQSNKFNVKQSRPQGKRSHGKTSFIVPQSLNMASKQLFSTETEDVFSPFFGKSPLQVDSFRQNGGQAATEDYRKNSHQPIKKECKEAKEPSSCQPSRRVTSLSSEGSGSAALSLDRMMSGDDELQEMLGDPAKSLNLLAPLPKDDKVQYLRPLLKTQDQKKFTMIPQSSTDFNSQKKAKAQSSHNASDLLSVNNQPLSSQSRSKKNSLMMSFGRDATLNRGNTTNPVTKKIYVDAIMKQLKIGVRVEKYHYSKSGSKICTLKLSEDYRTLSWRYDDQKFSSKTMDRYVEIRKIQSVIFGPQTYTFRGYKIQHLVNKLEYEVNQERNKQRNQNGEETGKEKPVPKFYAWECMSLKLKKRTIDFVISDESLMIKILQAISLLVSILSKNTPLKSLLSTSTSIRQNSQSNNKNQTQLNESNLPVGMLIPAVIYKVMRIKMKISYQAVEAQMSILEYMIVAMIKSYRQLRISELTDQDLWEEDQEEANCMKIPLMITAKMRNLMSMGSVFAPKLKGLAQLQTIRAKLRYQRLKFERYLSMQWEFGTNPCLRIPQELKIAVYPQSFQYYDTVPQLFAKYIQKRAKMLLSARDTFSLFLPRPVSQTVQNSPKNIISKPSLIPKCLKIIGEDEGDHQSLNDKDASTIKYQKQNTLSQMNFSQNLNKKDIQTNSKGTQVSKKTIIKAYIHLLSSLQELEDEEYDMEKLIMKQLHMRQMMGLKTKGRFLEETKVFESEMKQLPSQQSQLKVKLALDYETEDKIDEILHMISSAQSLEERHRIVNSQIYKEYFYFNPIYKTLLNKRNQVLRQVSQFSSETSTHDYHKAQQFLLNLPNLRQTVRYYKKRREVGKNWAEIEGFYAEGKPTI